METMLQPQTLQESIIYFSNLDVCHEFVTQLRWQNGVACPRCGSSEHSFISTRRVWKCNWCKKQFSVKVGTIFEDSPIGLDKWLAVIWMIANDKNDISSYKVHHAIGVTQKTAWFMLHRIRLAMQTDTLEKLSGEAEAHETSTDGRGKNMYKSKREQKIKGRGTSGKTVVMGLLQLDDDVRASVIPDTTKDTLQGEVKKHVEPRTEVFTDALPSYNGLNPEYLHQFVDHTVKYVEGKFTPTG